MNAIAEDLTQLSSKKLARRLEQIARDALPCVEVNAFDACAADGLTAGLWIESGDRRDVTDLARVLETEPGGHVTTGWSSLQPIRTAASLLLLLDVQFERPVSCEFTIGFAIGMHDTDSMRAALPLLLAAEGFALGFKHLPRRDRAALWVPAPRESSCVRNAICGL